MHTGLLYDVKRAERAVAEASEVTCINYPYNILAAMSGISSPPSIMVLFTSHQFVVYRLVRPPVSSRIAGYDYTVQTLNKRSSICGKYPGT